MKEEKIVRYEKPALENYRFALKVAAGDEPSQGGNIPEGCDSDFDE